jgi:S-adenosyl-L-methionine hydrolase (adenosine-forming)
VFRPIALLTDFGYTDAYVGVMKGVLLSRCPDARLIDLAHGVAPQDVLAGAVHLASAVPYCPPDTVFLAVVDPGVGSVRRPLCLRSGDQLFVGPDNGLLWPAAARTGEPEAFHLDRPEQWLPQPAATFHGRDIFAPVAALLALGRAPEEVGSPIPDPVRLQIPAPAVIPDALAGEIILVDHFGNAVTNFRPEALGNPGPYALTFVVGDRLIRGPATHYGAVGAGELLVIPGSLGYYEIAINRGNAASALGLHRGSPVIIPLGPDAGQANRG